MSVQVASTTSKNMNNLLHDGKQVDEDEGCRTDMVIPFRPRNKELPWSFVDHYGFSLLEDFRDGEFEVDVQSSDSGAREMGSGKQHLKFREEGREDEEDRESKQKLQAVFTSQGGATSISGGTSARGEPNEGTSDEAEHQRQVFQQFVKEEQTRFMHRENVSLIPTGVYFVALIYFFIVPPTLDEVILRFLNITVGCIDIGLHFKNSKDPQHAKIRSYCQFAFMLLAPMNVFQATTRSWWWCDDPEHSTFPLSSPVINAFTTEYTCRKVLNSFLIAPTTIVLTAFTPTIGKAVFAYIWALALILVIGPMVMLPLQFPEKEGGQNPLYFWMSSIVLLAVSVPSLLFLVVRRRVAESEFKLQLKNFFQQKMGERIEADQEVLLLSMVPPSALDRLSSNIPVRDFTEEGSVLFSDMEGFTAWSSQRTAAEVTIMLNAIVVKLDFLAERMGVEKVKTIGDAYWAVVGLPLPEPDHARILINFALTLHKVVAQCSQNNEEERTKVIKEEEKQEGVAAGESWGKIQWRVAINSGSLYGGILGSLRLSYEVYGETSDIAAAAEPLGIATQVVVTEKTLQSANLSSDGLDTKMMDWRDSSIITLFVLPEGLTSCDQIQPASPVSSGRQTSSRKQLSLIFGSEDPSPGSSLGHSSADVLRIEDLENPNLVNFSFAGARANSSAQAAETLVQAQQVLINRAAATGVSGTLTPTIRSPTVRSPAENPLAANGKVSTFEASNATAIHREEDEMSGGEAFQKDLENNQQEDGDTTSAILVHQPEENIDSGVENVEEKYSSRKYKYLWLDFANEEAEADFREFRATNQKTLFLISQCAMFALSWLCIVFILMETGLSINPLLGLLLLNAANISAIDLFIHKKILTSRKHALLHVGLQHFAVFSLLACALLTPFGVTMVLNDGQWLHVVGSGFVGLGSLPFIGGASIIGINSLVLSPLAFLEAQNRIHADAQNLHFVLINSLLFAVFYVQERRTRNVFKETRVAQFLEKKQRNLLRMQETLLESIVPSHTIPSLMIWLRGGMQQSQTVATVFENVNIAFLRLSKASKYAPGNLVVVAERANNSQVGGEPSLGSTSDEPAAAAAAISSSQQKQQLPTKMRWLELAHPVVDELIREYSGIDKIKTIGDTVMIAGPFTAEVSVSEAASQLLEFVFEIQQRLEEMADLRIGLNAGELVGAVLGRSKLCFDIFGDTVNTASRAMCSYLAADGDVVATTAFVGNTTLLSQGVVSEEAENSGNKDITDEQDIEEEEIGIHLQYELGEPVVVPAKGKGTIEVRKLAKKRRFLSKKESVADESQ